MTAKTEVIGTELGSVTFPVERGKIAEFARAVLADDHAAYFDPDRDGGIIAPPTFTQTIAFWERPEPDAPIPDFGLDFTRVVHGEQEFEYLAPIHAGDTLTATSRISDVYERETSKGVMSFVAFENRYVNQDGETVAISRMILLEPPLPGA